MTNRRAFYVGAFLILPFTLIMATAAQLSPLPYPPTHLFGMLVDIVPSAIAISGLAFTLGAVLAVNQAASTVVDMLGQIALLGTWLVVAGILSICIWRSGKGQQTSYGGAIIGALIGAAWGVIVAWLSIGSQFTTNHWGIDMSWCLLLLMSWGGLLGRIYRRLTTFQVTSASMPDPKRRQFIRQVAVGTSAATLVSTGGFAAAHRTNRTRRMQVLTASMSLPPHFPQTLQARIYRAGPDFHFPELAQMRYQPQKQPFGLCIAGGGTVAMCAATGVMRGLHSLGLVDAVGTISCVSGGAWFGSIWSYAPATIDDDTLLGPFYHPSNLTLKRLRELDPQHIMAPVPELTTVRLLDVKTEMMVASTRSEAKAFDRVYARTLNEVFLRPFGLDNPHKILTLNDASAAEIGSRNPQLTTRDFYTCRPNRSFFIAGISQIYPLGAEQQMRHFELSPLYSGTPQSFPSQGKDGADIGGGFVETFAFDSPTPLEITADGLATVPAPVPPFLLSDLMGSTGAAPGILVNFIEKPEWFPKFRHWSPGHTLSQAAPRYSFVDGGNLENSGIVPLLRRQYPVILALLGASQMVGSENLGSVNGIPGTIARLFGILPEQRLLNNQDTQVFPMAQFSALVQGMQQAVAQGGPAFFVDRYRIVQPNTFEIPAYPDNKEVTVVWLLNHLNQTWFEQLPLSVRRLFDADDPINNLSNFPNYSVFFQNSSSLGIPHMLLLTPEQINLKSQMWSYTITEDIGELLQQLRAQHLE